jgi:imidazolonepropionase-like amidohydrolase
MNAIVPPLALRARLTVLVLALVPLAGSAPAQEAEVAFVNVNVITMDGDPLANQNVLVSGDRIVAIGPADRIKIPQGAKRIESDAPRYLMPGMAELHGHIPPPADSKAYIENVLFLYVANGVTTVRGMLGHEGQLDLRQQANSGKLLSPSLYLAGPAFDGGLMPEQASQRVHQQKREGWDYLKILWGPSQAEYDALTRTAKEIGIPFVGHVPRKVGIRHVLASGQQTIDHLDGYIEYLDGAAGPIDHEKIAEVVKLTKESGAWLVPTMVVWENLFGDTPTETVLTYDGLKYLPPDLVKRWTESHRRRMSGVGFDRVAARHRIENRMRLLKAMNEGGVKILFGTDSPQQFSVPGFSIHREMQRMQQAGMNAKQILHSATAAAGEYFRDKDKFGTIAVGQRADLVLLKANPLDDIAHVSQQAGVMVRGRWLSEQDIASRLQQIAAKYEADKEK